MAKDLQIKSEQIYFAIPSAKKYHNQYFQNQPAAFVNVSITGTSCACNCEHCNAKLLNTMLPVATPQRFHQQVKLLKEQGCTGILISGTLPS